jgi:hypothetical protein
MSRMIDLIRSSAVPATLVQAAARGALSLPPAEMIEILVYLANHNQVFSQQARMTLAGWEEKSALAAAADPATPQEVLEYLVAPENLRPTLLPALLENPAVREEWLLKLAANGSRETVKAMMASRRVHASPPLENALVSNPNMTETGTAAVCPDEAAASLPAPGGPHQVLSVDAALAESAGSEDVLDEEVRAFFNQHAEEISAEEGKPFQAIGGIFDEPEAARVDRAEAGTSRAASGHVPAHKIAHAPTEESRRGSTLQKISSLDVRGRIQLAMKGNKEERSILIRDGTKIVALAVLDSPKITDGEVETFASQKNVLEAVLRGIPMKRRFAKHYPVVRNLVFNPRTPLDLSLSLIKNLLVTDLKNLSANKEVSDTVRKLALKMFKQKSEAGGKKKD